MLKAFKNYSLMGVVLFVSVLFLGLLFRILGLSSVSAWGDEIASLYYAQHLDRVFFHESHSPLYYLICKIWMSVFPSTIVSLRVLFVLMGLGVTSVSALFLYRKRGWGLALVFFILFWLWPTEIIYSRQARHYALYGELIFLLLILWDSRHEVNKWILWGLCCFVQLLHPLALIPVIFLLCYDIFKKTMSLSELRFYLTSTLPLWVYYVSRWFVLGQTKLLSNISWINNQFLDFQQALFLLLSGDSYPLTHVYPLSLLGSAVFLGVVMSLFYGFKSVHDEEKLKRFVLLYLVTVCLVEILLLFFTNLRVNRYFIYLVPFFLSSLLAFAVGNSNEKNVKLGSLLAMTLVVYQVFIFEPWRPYAWDDDNVSSFKTTLQELPAKPLVVCANAYQRDYYFQLPYKNCSDEVLELHLKKEPFYLFDITGNDKVLSLFLINQTQIERIEYFNQALFLSVNYPAKK